MVQSVPLGVLHISNSADALQSPKRNDISKANNTKPSRLTNIAANKSITVALPSEQLPPSSLSSLTSSTKPMNERIQVKSISSWRYWVLSINTMKKICKTKCYLKTYRGLLSRLTCDISINVMATIRTLTIHCYLFIVIGTIVLSTINLLKSVAWNLNIPTVVIVMP